MLPLSLCCLLVAVPHAQLLVISAARAPFVISSDVEHSGTASTPDSVQSLHVVRRRKRYVVRKKRWSRRLLTWRLDTSNIKEEDDYVVRATLHRAFHEWSSASSVRFMEVTEAPANIVVGFERGQHQDAFPFDGKDGIVAHAFYPRDGRLHFDADEDWSLNSPHGVNLYQTAVHEIGHLLGLEHSVDPRAVMFAARRPYDPDFSLADDDVRAIRVLFPIGDVMSNHDHVEDSRATTSNDRNREMTVSQVVENLDGGPPPSQHAPEDELTFPFPLPRLGIAYTRNSAIL